MNMHIDMQKAKQFMLRTTIWENNWHYVEEGANGGIEQVIAKFLFETR